MPPQFQDFDPTWLREGLLLDGNDSHRSLLLRILYDQADAQDDGLPQGISGYVVSLHMALLGCQFHELRQRDVAMCLWTLPARKIIATMRCILPWRHMIMDNKRKAILDRIKYLEEAIIKAHEYLESGKHADCRGFRPLFDVKVRDGKVLPTHKDWVKNVVIRNLERRLRRAEKLLDRFT